MYCVNAVIVELDLFLFCIVQFFSNSCYIF